MRVAGSEGGTSLTDVISLPTPPDSRNGVRALADAARKIAGTASIEIVSGGVPGPLRAGARKLGRLPNLPGWAHASLAEDLEREMGAAVLLANDTEMEALGEARMGAGAQHAVVAYVAAGTGVGGARVVNGRVEGRGAEPGHQIIRLEGRPCGCGGFGHLESYAGGANVQAKYGIPPERITDPGAWDEITRSFAAGLCNLAVLWTPDIFILGGSMILGDPAIPLDRVEAHLREFLSIYEGVSPPLARAELGERAGLLGALLRAGDDEQGKQV